MKLWELTAVQTKAAFPTHRYTECDCQRLLICIVDPTWNINVWSMSWCTMRLCAVLSDGGPQTMFEMFVIIKIGFPTSKSSWRHFGCRSWLKNQERQLKVGSSASHFQAPSNKSCPGILLVFLSLLQSQTTPMFSTNTTAMHVSWSE